MVSKWQDVSNEQLLACYADLDFQAFEVFFKRNQRHVFNFLLLRCKNRSDAEDAFQETFLRVHKYILKYDQTLPALPWIFSIAKNVAYDLSKKKSGVETPTESIEQEDPSKTVEEKLAAKEELQLLLKDLSEDERCLIQERLVEDREFEFIAQTHQITPANARKRMSLLLKRLRGR